MKGVHCKDYVGIGTRKTKRFIDLQAIIAACLFTSTS